MIGLQSVSAAVFEGLSARVRYRSVEDSCIDSAVLIPAAIQFHSGSIPTPESKGLDALV